MKTLKHRPYTQPGLYRNITKIQNYNCRFLPYDTKVNLLYLRDKKILDKMYYTVPLEINNDKSCFNVIPSFICDKHAEYNKNVLQEIFNEHVYLEKKTLTELSIEAFAVKLPFVVILNNYFDLNKNEQCFEIFYSSRVLIAEQDCEAS